MRFIATWTGSRVPRTVDIPYPGRAIETETVNYMRDGVCLFMSGLSAAYTRIDDHSAEFEIVQSADDMNTALAGYWEKQ